MTTSLIPKRFIMVGTGRLRRNAEILFYDCSIDGYVRTRNTEFAAAEFAAMDQPVYQDLQAFQACHPGSRAFLLLATPDYSADVAEMEALGWVHHLDFIHLFDAPGRFNRLLLERPHALHVTPATLHELERTLPQLVLNAALLLTTDPGLLGLRVAGRTLEGLADHAGACQEAGIPILIADERDYYTTADQLAALGLAERKDFYSLTFLKTKLLYSPISFIETVMAEPRFNASCDYYETSATFSKDVIDPCCLTDKHRHGVYFIRSFMFKDVNEAFDCLPMRAYKLMTLNNSFSLCHVPYCSVLLQAKGEPVPLALETAKQRMAKRPGRLILDADNYCNLTCPSCRDHNDMNLRIKHTARAVARHLATLDLSAVTEIACALYGEMLASRSNVEMIRNLKLKHWPGIRFQLRTNGTLLHTPAFTEVMDSVGPLDVVLSMDGASKATFERLRRGADFGRVLDNLKILARLREAGRIKFFQVTTVVQQDNFRELQAVLDLAREARADLVRFDRYQLQTQGLEEYERCDVQRRDHPDHAAFLEISRKIQSRPAGTPVVLWNPAPPEG